MTVVTSPDDGGGGVMRGRAHKQPDLETVCATAKDEVWPRPVIKIYYRPEDEECLRDRLQKQISDVTTSSKSNDGMIKPVKNDPQPTTEKSNRQSLKLPVNKNIIILNKSCINTIGPLIPGSHL